MVPARLILSGWKIFLEVVDDDIRFNSLASTEMARSPSKWIGSNNLRRSVGHADTDDSGATENASPLLRSGRLLCGRRSIGFYYRHCHRASHTNHPVSQIVLAATRYFQCGRHRFSPPLTYAMEIEWNQSRYWCSVGGASLRGLL